MALGEEVICGVLLRPAYPRLLEWVGDGGTRRIVFVSGKMAMGLEPMGGIAASGEGTEAKCLNAEEVGPIGAEGSRSPVSIRGRGGCERS